MTAEEAKEFYFQYFGISFHMDREKPKEYNEFKQLNLSKETLCKWDEQLLDLLFTEFNSAQAKTWISHGKILKVIDRGNCNSKEELKHLLDAMETKNFNDLADLTMVIENMAGRSGPAKDGGSFIFFKYSGDTNRMNEIMEEKIALHRDEKDVRFKEAVRRYRSTYKKFEGSDF